MDQFVSCSKCRLAVEVPHDDPFDVQCRSCQRAEAVRRDRRSFNRAAFIIAPVICIPMLVPVAFLSWLTWGPGEDSWIDDTGTGPAMSGWVDDTGHGP
jgi:hypothetical protein